jgi:hypothetical protein
MVAYKFVEEMKIKENDPFKCFLYKSSLGFGIRLIPKVEFIEDELIDHSAEINEFIDIALSAVNKILEIKETIFIIHLYYTWRVPKTNEQGNVNKVYVIQNNIIHHMVDIENECRKQLFSNSSFSIKNTTESLFTTSGRVKIKPLFWFETPNKKEKLIYKRALGAGVSLCEDKKGNKYIRTERIFINTESYISNFTGIIYSDHTSEISFSICENGQMQNKYGTAVLDQFSFGEEPWAMWSSYRERSYIKFDKPNENFIELDRIKDPTTGLEKIKFLTPNSVVEIDNIPGLTTETYEDKFVRLFTENYLVKNRKIPVYEFKFEL